MTPRTPQTSPPRGRDDRPTVLDVRRLRADIVLADIIANPELVERVEDIAKIPRLAGWSDQVRETAIADLVTDGTLTEAADGRLCVNPRRRNAA